ncbi:MAG: zinc-ribbon domain-containing protein [Blautia sp.]|nr:zinc-ribbon domain-containing protein [Blautia sp.]
MYCINCGAEIKEGAVFCSNCGEPVVNEQGDDTVSVGEYGGRRNDSSDDSYYMNSPVVPPSPVQAESRHNEHIRSRYGQEAGSGYEQEAGGRYEQDTGSGYEQKAGRKYKQEAGHKYKKDTGRRSSRKLKKKSLVFIIVMIIAAGAAFSGAIVNSLKSENSDKTEETVVNDSVGMGENTSTTAMNAETAQSTAQGTASEPMESTLQGSEAGSAMPGNGIAGAEPAPEANPSEQAAPGITTSTYEVVIGNYSWTAASSECRSKGGHLATLDSPEEFRTVITMLENNANWNSKVFFVGGRRDLSGNQYFWVDGNNQPYGTPLNDSSSWLYPYWPAGEPSFSDEGVQEEVCSIFKYQGSWIINDEPDNVLATVPEYSGIIGYICEYETSSGSNGGSAEAGSGSGASASADAELQAAGTESTVSPANVDSSLREAYVRMLAESGGALDYFVYDIDKDGYPELFLEYAESPDSHRYRTHCVVYTHKNGVSTNVGQISGIGPTVPELCSAPGMNAVLNHSVVRGYEQVWSYSLENNQLVENKLYVSELNEPQKYYFYEPLGDFNTDVFNASSFAYTGQYFYDFTSPYMEGSLMLQRSRIDDYRALDEALAGAGGTAGVDTAVLAEQTNSHDYEAFFSGALADLASRQGTSVDELSSSGYTYSLVDMQGDGIKELMFYRRGGRQYATIWAYSLEGSSWKLMEEIECPPMGVGSTYGYDNGFIATGVLKMGDHIEFGVAHYKWNGAGFDGISIFSGSYSSPSEIPTVEQLGEEGYYNKALITEKAPEFRNVSDMSLVK